MGIPDALDDGGERTSINYNYTDTSNGTGIEIYYGAKGDNGEYLTLTSAIPSEEITTFIEDQTITTSFVKLFDIDFDIVFNLPKNLKGNVIVSVPMGISATSAGAGTFNYYCIVQVVHYDGSTETVLGTGTSKTTTKAIETDGINHSSRTHLLKIPISTLKHFKKGETLRLIVEGWYSRDSVQGEAHIIMGHDPLGRIFDIGSPEESSPTTNVEIRLANEGSGGIVDLTTKMQFHVPFVIDL